MEQYWDTSGRLLVLSPSVRGEGESRVCLAGVKSNRTNRSLPLRTFLLVQPAGDLEDVWDLPQVHCQEKERVKKAPRGLVDYTGRAAR